MAHGLEARATSHTRSQSRTSIAAYLLLPQRPPLPLLFPTAPSSPYPSIPIISHMPYNQSRAGPSRRPIMNPRPPSPSAPSASSVDPGSSSPALTRPETRNELQTHLLHDLAVCRRLLTLIDPYLHKTPPPTPRYFSCICTSACRQSSSTQSPQTTPLLPSHSPADTPDHTPTSHSQPLNPDPNTAYLPATKAQRHQGFLSLVYFVS